VTGHGSDLSLCLGLALSGVDTLRYGLGIRLNSVTVPLSGVPTDARGGPHDYATSRVVLGLWAFWHSDFRVPPATGDFGLA
jgi:hypothetical protein